MSLSLRLSGALLAGATLLGGAAQAHVSISGPGFAGQNQILVFNAGHGCEGADTYRIEVTIPKAVSSVRGLPNSFGEADVQTDDTGAPVAVVWTKPDVRPADDQYYQVAIRIKVPDQPFTTLHFPTSQTCRDAEGVETTIKWDIVAEGGGHGGGHGSGHGGEDRPAPALKILPPRMTGWNEYTVPHAIDDLAIFDDAQIVWMGGAAHSANPTTQALIEGEPDVTVLEKIPAGSKIWVKY